MTEIFLVAAGGFVGAISRYIIGKKWNHSLFPFGTLMVNLLGAFLLGIFAGMQVTGHIYSLMGVGFMGAFTTFSTLMLEAEQQRKNKQNRIAYVYLAVTFGFGIILAYFGMYIGKSII